jgi:hypothetical protein
MPESPDSEEDYNAWEFYQMRTDAELLGLDCMGEEAMTASKIVLAATIQLRKLRRELSVALAYTHLSEDTLVEQEPSSRVQPAHVWRKIRKVQASRDMLLLLYKRAHADEVSGSYRK